MLILLALGAAVGFFAGLFGIGGGGMMVPALTTLFIAKGFPSGQVVHLALGTSMAAIVMTSLSSLRAHHAKGAVLWPVVRHITPGILLGTFAATFLATYLSSRHLATFFACFMAYVSLQMVLNVKPKPHRELPGAAVLASVGAAIGAVSALVAIGGGSLTVPYLTWCNVNIRNAIATSAAVGLPIALAGALGYLLNGWGQAGLPEHTLGYIYWPAVVLISGVSYFTTPFGAHLAHSLPIPTLKKAFALLLILLSLKMLHSVL
ncbi:sulfite exporter TauE/SafE family protein [Candidatus Thiothrix phosphatis]|uniref:sulfite exporter TauE/SafE family protein n=1 Tax=Candidatus Thiothrix phosphatis TaxID=3112415 RepID=UPI002D77CF49|nr:sulfite exporter TauE/SafE family protein [Candidatus Thiothrix sp. Deng01]